MPFEFYKYQGTGNDFILIDNRTLHFPKNDSILVAHLCDRKFGVGADGLILLDPHSDLDFKMVYYNSDGNLSSMCGNGGRCLVHFAKYLGIIENSAQFEAADGIHKAKVENEMISLGMNSVHGLIVNEDHIFLNTGSPHHVQMVDEILLYDVFKEGKKIRNERYGVEGANVNFVKPLTSDTFHVRTYERGVENETLSCGTGVTAVAIAMYETGRTQSLDIKLQTPGGKLTVSFEKTLTHYENVQLIGPAVQVFKGYWP
jgi:diaminopimelate epimerase